MVGSGQGATGIVVGAPPGEEPTKGCAHGEGPPVRFEVRGEEGLR